MPNIGPAELILLAFLVVPGIPAYVVGERRGVPAPAVAFFPIVAFWVYALTLKKYEPPELIGRPAPA